VRERPYSILIRQDCLYTTISFRKGLDVEDGEHLVAMSVMNLIGLPTSSCGRGGQGRQKGRREGPTEVLFKNGRPYNGPLS